MGDRITTKRIEARLRLVNTVLGRPRAAWVKDKETGRLTAQIGNLHVSCDGEPRRYQVHEMVTDGGGVRTHGPYGTKRKVYEYLQGILDGRRFLREWPNQEDVVAWQMLCAPHDTNGNPRRLAVVYKHSPTGLKAAEVHDLVYANIPKHLPVELELGQVAITATEYREWLKLG